MLISTDLQKSAFYKLYDIQERVHLIETEVKRQSISPSFQHSVDTKQAHLDRKAQYH
jgi:hypothetical protein